MKIVIVFITAERSNYQGLGWGVRGVVVAQILPQRKLMMLTRWNTSTPLLNDELPFVRLWQVWWRFLKGQEVCLRIRTWIIIKRCVGNNEIDETILLWTIGERQDRVCDGYVWQMHRQCWTWSGSLLVRLVMGAVWCMFKKRCLQTEVKVWCKQGKGSSVCLRPYLF